MLTTTVKPLISSLLKHHHLHHNLLMSLLVYALRFEVKFVLRKCTYLPNFYPKVHVSGFGWRKYKKSTESEAPIHVYPVR